MEKTFQNDQILNQITDGFIALDHEFCCTKANIKVGKMRGLGPDKLIGKNVWNIFPFTNDSITYKSYYEAYSQQKYVCSIDYYSDLKL